MTLAGVLATSGLAGLVVASSASAAVPVFPDNLIVFPNRDFVSILGYADHANETATVRVTRPGVGVVGSATGVVSGGDVAFEVNHPGGVCWGNGTGLNVTPDIQPRDVVTISFGPKGETLAGDTTAQDTFVTEKSVLGGATLDTLTVRGHIGADVDPANTEQRIIEPNLTATTVGRRDIRALPGPMTRAAKGGYSSSLEFTGDTFLATYVFDDPAVAKIAADASLGERMLSWQFVDGAANRQALTIAERGEPGGPGMGGCPNGPLQSGPVGPTDVTAVNVSGGMKLNWTPAVAVAGTPAITGYRATAVARTVNGNNEQVEMGRRIAGVGATGTTITGLSSSETYDVEVVSVSSVGLTFPPVKTDVVTDVTPPTVNASVSGGSYPAAQKVTLSANEPGSDIYYTTDGSDPVLGDVASATAVHYSGPLTISADTTLKYVAFDLANNVSTIGEQVYKITIVAVAPVPTTPAFTTTSAGEGSVTLSWADSDTSITGYEVQAYDSAGTAKVGNPYPTSLSTIKITDLPTDVAYTFGVVAINANGRSAESAKSGPLTPLGAVVAVAGPDQTIVRKTTATTVSLTGDGSTATGATYDWAQVLNGASDPDKVVLTGATTLTPRFTLELFKYPMTNKPRTFRLTVKSASGTKSDDVVVNVTPDQVSIVTAKWKAGDFRVTGAGSVTGGTITVHPGSLAAGTIPAWEAPMTAAAAPATGGVFDLRLKNGATPPRPTTVWIESSLGGTSGPFTVG